MASWTLDQAIRDAFESERAATRFFQAQASAETSNERRALYLQSAESAQRDASKLESVASRVEEGEFAHYAEIDVGSVPKAPSWVYLDKPSGSDPVPIARDFAYRAALFYDLLAEASPTHGPLFRELAALKEELAHHMEGLQRPATGTESAEV
jgi:hypothetical protein